MTFPRLTELQARQMLRAVDAYPEAIRAETAGDRVTLASLHARGHLTREAWRTSRCERDNAYEYRCSASLAERMRARRAARQTTDREETR